MSPSDPLEKLNELITAHRAALVKHAATLGLPLGEVDGRIALLHQALQERVAEQRREAEKEVQIVRERVNGVRQSVKDMRAALGDTTEEAEDAKEPLLAALSRLEGVHADLLTAHTARIAQFQTVYQHFERVLPVLGPDFSSVRLPPANWSTQPDDLRIGTLSALEKEVNRCNEEIERRQGVLESHLAEVLALWSEMGIQPGQTDEASSSEHDFDLAMLAHLTPDDPTTLPPTVENLTRASTAREWLEGEKHRREQVIQETYDDLYTLWTRLGMSEEDQDAFLENWKGLDQRCVDAYGAEKERMIQLKLDNMAIFVQREREDIERLWREIYVSVAEQVQWHRQHDHLEGDDVLEAYEQERKRLEGELQSRAAILIPLNRYFELKAEIEELAEAAKDPNRYKSRGDPGRILREEKQRKRHAKEKPKLEAELLAAIPQWEQAHGQPFLVNGARYLDELAEVAPAKKGGVPPRSKTPAPGERAKTPAPTERAKTPGPSSRPGTAAGRPATTATTAKRAGTASVAATPTVAKRPRADTQSTIKPFGSTMGNTASKMPPPSRPASRAAPGGGIPQLVYPAPARQVSREWKPRPSLTSLSGVSATSGDSLFSHRTGSTAPTLDGYDALGIKATGDEE